MCTIILQLWCWYGHINVCSGLFVCLRCSGLFVCLRGRMAATVNWCSGTPQQSLMYSFIISDFSCALASKAWSGAQLLKSQITCICDCKLNSRCEIEQIYSSTICPADNATAGSLGRRRAGQLRFGFVAVSAGHIVYIFCQATLTGVLKAFLIRWPPTPSFIFIV
jgi:hypothetical protein